MDHRPLSRWITRAQLTDTGIVRWDQASEVNFGDERADARELPGFGPGWQRRAVPSDLGYYILALVGGRAQATVLELDNLATPIRVTPGGAEVISRIEDDWPVATVSQAESALLAGEEIVLRHLLLARLSAEGRPPPALFHLLPWDLVDMLATQITVTLDGHEPGPVIALRHWFSPVGSRFTAAIEQLDEGLRVNDVALTRVGATSLCARILDTDVARLPGSTRQALARLITVLGQQNRFLAPTAARAVQRLAGSPEQETPAGAPARLDSRLPSAAHSAPGVRREFRDVPREPFAFRLTVTAAGRAEVSIRAPFPADQDIWLVQAYGVLLQPVVLLGAGPATRYLIPLRHTAGELSGLLSVPLPPGPSVQADLDGPPIGVAEARYLSTAEVERSIRGLRTRSARALWDQVAAVLPPAHPLRALIARETS